MQVHIVIGRAWVFVVSLLVASCGDNHGLTRELVEVAVTPGQPSIAAGTSVQLSATGRFSDDTVEDLTAQVAWSSATPTVATVGGGLVAGLRAGTSAITAALSGASATVVVTVTDARLVSLEVTPVNASIANGTSLKYTATGVFTDHSTQDVTEQVTWTTSAASFATISNAAGSRGLAHAEGVGTMTIGAAMGTVTGSTSLTVTDATLASIDVQPVELSVAKGGMVSFTATGNYSDGSTQNLTEQVTWSSANPAVANASNPGLAKGSVTADDVGTTEIRATDPTTGLFGRATLTVTDAVLVAIEVTPTAPVIAKGTSQQLVAMGVYSDRSVQELTTQVAWTSSATDVATISNTSPTQGLATTSIDTVPGPTTITATLGTISGSTELTVTAAALVSIDVTPIDPVIPNGVSLPFTATGTYSDGSTQDLTLGVTWAATAGATVSNAADSAGVVTAQAASGTATITATDVATGISGASTVTLGAARLTSITVQPDPVSLPKGTTVQFAAELHFSDGQIISTTDATWSSSSAGLAISNAAGSRGLATALADAGTAIVSATDPASGVSGEATVTLTAAALVRIEVDPANQTLPRGTTDSYAATGIYSDFTTQDLTGVVTWSSSNTAAATISNAAGSQGMATTLAPGATTISATDPATGIVGQATLVVGNTVLTSITITPVDPTIAKGARLQFVATGHYDDGGTRNLTQFVSWSASSPNVAGVSNAPKKRGIATGKSRGTTTITATDPVTLISGSTTLTVSTATLQSITVTPISSTIPNKTMAYFTATGNFSDGSSSDLTAAVSWSSSNVAIATISNQTFNNGVATGVSPGTVTITAFDSTSGLDATATLTVSSATLVAIVVTPATPSIIAGTALPMVATGTFSDGSTKDITREVTWTSGNTAIATVLNVGSMKGTVTGVAVGTTSIAANYPQTMISNSTTVTVIP